jgi:glucosamine--fructose-6-phosphate aminotransferase (isomerizing)
MCGIIGYIGDKNAVPILIEGLKKLEYRGYDSAGVCTVDSCSLISVKEKGKIVELEANQKLNKINSNLGIAHTRWATHGKPDSINAHPHFDCKENIAIVHNGIIENYQSLKELLINEGHKFISETDSEVLAHLIEKFYEGDLSSATLKALKCVEGTFGLAVIHKDHEEIVIAKKSSPLVIGIGEKEMFVASDVVAILNYTNKVIYLNDDEVALIRKENYSIKDLRGNNIDKKIYEIKYSAQEIEKGGFKHFMLKEIFEQPKAIENTLRGRLKNGKIKLTVNLNLEKIKRITIVACGTSWHSALIGKYYLEKLTGIPVNVDYASEFRYRDPIVGEEDLVIVISQSGETADTLAALKEAKRKKAKTLGIINVVGSTIAREVDSGIYLHAGPEIGVASTKAFSCQVIALLLLSLFIRQEKGLILNENLVKELELLPDKIKQVLENSKNAKKIAIDFAKCNNFLYLGRGINFPVALEGALKLKEISYIHAEGYPAAEMKHGPIALVDENMPIVFVSPQDSTYEKIISNIEEAKARGGKIIAITNKDDTNLNRLTDGFFQVPKTEDFLSPILNVIPLQLLAYYISDLKGLDVDKPRNLAKSVTVE